MDARDLQLGPVAEDRDNGDVRSKSSMSWSLNDIILQLASLISVLLIDEGLSATAGGHVDE